MSSVSGVKGNVLIVDDEPNAIKVLSAILKGDGFKTFESGDAENALKMLGRHDVDAVITDMKMPGKDGMQLYDQITQLYPDIPVIFLTAFGTVDSAVHAITHGAFYYFIKPPDYHKLKGILARAVEQRCLKRELESLKRMLAMDGSAHRIIGSTPEMTRVLETANAVKDSSSSVLICGETGTGKELIARLLHYHSFRKDRPFVAVNCAAMPRDLMESELFGYEKGAFTGAMARRIGRFEEAADGTIFLDEIGELEQSLQAKLLRVLQEKEIERLGSNRKIPVNFRLVSSTNRDLKMEVECGNFREDLYYRLNVVVITVPPLRERKDDIPLLVSEFFKEFCTNENKVLTVSDEVMEIFMNYHWPGNIRQLRNVVERAVVLTKGKKTTSAELPEELLVFGKKCLPVGRTSTLREMEAKAIIGTLQECRGNKSKVAKILGISRKSLYKKLQELDLGV